MHPVASQGQDDAFSDAGALTLTKQRSRAVIQGRLFHQPLHVGIGPRQYFRGMKFLQLYPAKILAAVTGNAVACQPAGELLRLAVVFVDPHYGQLGGDARRAQILPGRHHAIPPRGIPVIGNRQQCR